MKKIYSSGIPPEEYEREIIRNIPHQLLATSEMTDTERRFVNGLIRYHRPKRLLEIGVSQGGGSLLMLNAIQDIAEAHLTSIDIMECFYRDKNIPVGAIAAGKYDPTDPGSRWTLITGKDPVDVMDSFDSGFDFCVIDTAHRHPIESLNFLTVFPYLAKDAIVVLHDIALYLSPTQGLRNCVASKLLFESVVADKLLPGERYVPEHLSCSIPNIGAFQITPDTRRYITDVFSMLSFSWGMPPQSVFAQYEFFRQHYDEACIAFYRQAVVANWQCHFGEKAGIPLPLTVAVADHLRALWDEIRSLPQIVFYGAGKNCVALMNIWRALKLKPPCEIWDINARDIHLPNAIPVVPPRFERVQKASDNGLPPETAIVITIGDSLVSETVRRQFCESGYTRIYKYQDEILPAIAQRFADL
jgi:predicted O-methyltransferase YrrM